jgi:glycosyltransferase involved in cell wall biosynthesis
MNILMIGSDRSATDSGSPLAARLRAYGEHATSIHVLVIGKGRRREDVQLSPNVWVHARPSRTGILSFLRSTRHARELIAHQAIDVVSAQNPFEHGWVAARAVLGSRAKLHLQVHTDYLSPWFTRGAIFRSPQVRMPLLNRVRVRLADRIVPKAHGIRVVSQRIKDSLVARYGAAIPEPAVLPLRTSTDVPPAVPLPPLPFTFALLTVGRLEAEKRIQDLIEVIVRLRDAYPSLGLVIVGDGSQRRRLARYARKRGVADRVVFLGWRSDAWGLMQSANAYIQASAYEGCQGTLLEAALAGIPIITTDVGIVGEVFVGYENVFAAPVGDPSNLAALTARLIEDHLARRTLSIEGKRAAQTFLAAAKNSPADIVADMARTLSRP